MFQKLGWTRIAAVAMVMCAIAVLGSMAKASTTAQAGSDPMTAVQNLIDKANASFPTGDGATFATAFTENGVFAQLDDGSFAVVGRTAMTFAFSNGPDAAFHVTLVNSAVNGNTVTGTVQVVDSNAVAAEVARYVQPFTATADGGLVSSLILRYDLSDPQTQTYIAYQDSQSDGGGPPPGATTLDLAGTQAGQVSIGNVDPSAPGVAFVGINIAPGASGVIQPAHIHTGTCASPGPIVYPLASLQDGSSFTLLSASAQQLFGSNYIVNVHLSADAIGTYVSCAVLRAPVAAPTPGPTATPLPSLGNTGTGGASDGNVALPWLISMTALAVGGIAGSLAIRRRRS